MLDNIFKIVYFVCLIAGSVVRAVYTKRNRIVHTKRHKQDTIADDRETLLDKLLLFLIFLGMIVTPLIYALSSWLDFADYNLPTWACLTAGLVGSAVFVVALWLLWRSHADLGRNWSPHVEIMKSHSLVTEGVFHYIRHPMYAAHWLWGIAQVLLLQNWIAGFVMMVSLFPLYLVRVPREEKMMLDHFGEEYRLYMNRTGRIVPRL